MAFRPGVSATARRTAGFLTLAVFAFSAFPAHAFNITWSQDTSLSLPGTGIALTIDAGSNADSLTVNPSSFTVVVANGETFTVRYPGPSYGTMGNDGGISDCNAVGSDNVSVVTGPKTVTFTPSSTTCTPPASGGGGGSGNTVPASVRLYAPNGGETVPAGGSFKVFWTYAGSQARSASLALSLDGGAYAPLVSGVNHAQGYADVTMPSPTADASARMRVQLLGDGGTVLASDESDAAFLIDVLQPPAREPQPEPDRTETGEMPEEYDPRATIGSDKALAPASTAQAAFCREHELVKLPDDGNPVTQHDSAVYYCGPDGKRYGFPNAKIYATWYADFSRVRVVTQEELSALPLGGNVTYRPGTRLVKIQSDPNVYAVNRDGLIRHVPDETTAVILFGSAWSALVDDVDVAFFTDYRIGIPLPSKTTAP